MFAVLSLIFAEHHDVVKVDNDKLANDVFPHIIHDVPGALVKPKHSTLKLEQTEGCSECCFGHIFRFQPDLIVG